MLGLSRTKYYRTNVTVFVYLMMLYQKSQSLTARADYRSDEKQAKGRTSWSQHSTYCTDRVFLQ